jgi:hypothetical protein
VKKADTGRAKPGGVLIAIFAVAVIGVGAYFLLAGPSHTSLSSTVDSISGQGDDAASGGQSSATGDGGSSCAPPDVCAPKGDLPGWKQVFVTDFPGTVPVGAFSDCNNDVNSPQAACNGLRPYGEYYANWWAYPSGWPDTAKSGADGNVGAPFGGVYRPELTVSVGGGAMHIRMFRPSTGGENAVATVVPRKCMDRQYGRYSERFRVVHADPGFKSAHLFYQGGYEIDYPENDYDRAISAYVHPGGATFATAAKWSDWHTTDIEWTPGVVKFYLDGALIGTATDKVPSIKMSWILQNESSIIGPYAAPGASAQLDIDWVSCYAPSAR